MFRRLLAKLQPEPPAGARFVDSQRWRVPPQRDAAVWLRALPVLFPDGAILYFEGTIDSEIASWLSARAVPETLKIAAGTIWPKPDVYHVPLTAESVESLAALVDHLGVPLPAIHVHVHDGQRVLLEWHDALRPIQCMCRRRFLSSALPHSLPTSVSGRPIWNRTPNGGVKLPRRSD